MVKNVIPKHLEATTAKLVEIGCEVEEFDDAVRVVASKRTEPYPCEDAALSRISYRHAAADRVWHWRCPKGTSIVTESIFENRFKYVDELTRMGANIKVEGNTAIIDGREQADTGARSVHRISVQAQHLVIAGLAAEGITIVDDIEYIRARL